MENDGDENDPAEFRRIRFTWIQPHDGWGFSSFHREMAALIHHLAITAEMETMAELNETVVGDEHPDALGMIMDAYNKHKESRDE